MRNFQPLEVVGRGSETQLQVAENLNKLTQQYKILCEPIAIYVGYHGSLT